MVVGLGDWKTFLPVKPKEEEEEKIDIEASNEFTKLSPEAKKNFWNQYAPKADTGFQKVDMSASKEFWRQFKDFAEQKRHEQKYSYIPESKIKDCVDALVLGSANIWHRTKQFFKDLLPNAVFQESKGTMHLGGVELDYRPEEDVEEINQKKRELREVYKEKYEAGEQAYENWLLKHPEYIPRPEWDGGVLENIKNNPSLLLDPGYWGYVAASTAPFTIAILGVATLASATAGVALPAGILGMSKALTQSILGGVAGIGAAYPLQAQDLYEDLIENGATEAQAANLSIPLGAVIALVEVLGDLPLLASFSKPFQKVLYGNIKNEVIKKALANPIIKGATTFVTAEISETLEEVVQEAIQDATVKTVNNERKILENIGEITVATLIATAPFSIMGGIGDYRATKIQSDIWKYGKDSGTAAGRIAMNEHVTNLIDNNLNTIIPSDMEFTGESRNEVVRNLKDFTADLVEELIPAKGMDKELTKYAKERVQEQAQQLANLTEMIIPEAITADEVASIREEYKQLVSDFFSKTTEVYHFSDVEGIQNVDPEYTKQTTEEKTSAFYTRLNRVEENYTKSNMYRGLINSNSLADLRTDLNRKRYFDNKGNILQSKIKDNGFFGYITENGEVRTFYDLKVDSLGKTNAEAIDTEFIWKMKDKTEKGQAIKAERDEIISQAKQRETAERLFEEFETEQKKRKDFDDKIMNLLTGKEEKLELLTTEERKLLSEPQPYRGDVEHRQFIEGIQELSNEMFEDTFDNLNKDQQEQIIEKVVEDIKESRETVVEEAQEAMPDWLTEETQLTEEEKADLLTEEDIKRISEAPDPIVAIDEDIKQLQSEVDAIIDDMVRDMKETSGQGVLSVLTKDVNENVTGRITESRNPVWYQELYRELGKKPNNQELRQEAVHILLNGSVEDNIYPNNDFAKLFYKLESRQEARTAIENYLEGRRDSSVQAQTPAEIEWLRQSGNLTADQIADFKVGVMLEDVEVTNTMGRKITLKKDTPYHIYDLGDGKYRLQDGNRVTVYEGTLENLQQYIDLGEGTWSGGKTDHPTEPGFEREEISKIIDKSFKETGRRFIRKRETSTPKSGEGFRSFMDIVTGVEQRAGAKRVQDIDTDTRATGATRADFIGEFTKGEKSKDTKIGRRTAKVLAVESQTAPIASVYHRADMKLQAELAVDFVNNNFAEAYTILMEGGVPKAPDGTEIFIGSVYNAFVNEALRTNEYDMLYDIATVSDVSQYATFIGQIVKSFDAMGQFDAVSAIKKLGKAKKESALRRDEDFNQKLTDIVNEIRKESQITDIDTFREQLKKLLSDRDIWC